MLDAFGRLEESQERPETRRAKVLVALGQDVTDAERAAAEAKGELPREAAAGADRDPARQGRRRPRRARRSGRGALRQDREVAQITRNIVDVLRRVRPRVRSAGR